MATSVSNTLSAPDSSTVPVGGGARALDGQQRQELAVQVLARTAPVTELSARHQVSRKFLYQGVKKIFLRLQ